jgi:tRNA (adenine57-N1/adenine58-N1)-methyltransferase
MEQRAQTFHHDNGTAESAKANGTSVEKPSFVTKQQRLADIRDAQADRRLYKEGRLLHRVEQQIRTHTSYLVFAILPQEWTPEDEARAQERWTASQPVAPGGRGNHLSRRQRKKNANAEVSSHH